MVFCPHQVLMNPQRWKPNLRQQRQFQRPSCLGLTLTPRRARWTGARVESEERTRPSSTHSRRRGTRRHLRAWVKLVKVIEESKRRNQNIFTLAKGVWARQTGDRKSCPSNLHPVSYCIFSHHHSCCYKNLYC